MVKVAVAVVVEEGNSSPRDFGHSVSAVRPRGRVAAQADFPGDFGEEFPVWITSRLRGAFKAIGNHEKEGQQQERQTDSCGLEEMEVLTAGTAFTRVE